MRGAGAVQQLGRRVAALLGDGEQHVLGGHELVLEASGFVEGALQDLVQRLREVRSGLHTGGLGQVAEEPPGFRHDGIRLHVALGQHRPHDPFFFFRQGDEQMQRENHLALVLFGHRLRLLQCLLGFLSELVQPKHLVPL